MSRRLEGDGFQIEFPSGFDPWIANLKGYVPDVKVGCSGRTYVIDFFDKKRVVEDFSGEIEEYGYSLIVNMLVLDEISVSSVTEAVRKIISNGEIKRLSPE